MSDDWSEVDDAYHIVDSNVMVAADALVEWYQDNLDLELFLIAMDNEIAVMEVAEAMNDGR